MVKRCFWTVAVVVAVVVAVACVGGPLASSAIADCGVTGGCGGGPK
jgi:hypothetical protein